MIRWRERSNNGKSKHLTDWDAVKAKLSNLFPPNTIAYETILSKIACLISHNFLCLFNFMIRFFRIKLKYEALIIYTIETAYQE